jgi:hypothetical protein
MENTFKVVSIEKLSIQEANWYGANQECFQVKFHPYAPTKEFAIINKRGMYDTNPKTGYLRGNGNLGSYSLLFTNLDTVEKFKNNLK